MTAQFNYCQLTENDFAAVIKLGNQVHGDGYLSMDTMKQWYTKGLANNINASYVVYDNDKLIGFRLTFAADNWQLDKWCTTDKWQADKENVCYFKCNTVDENYRGHGIGSKLLALSIASAKKQGAVAGVSHLWMQSPGNSAVKYFTKCGGTLIKVHADRWLEDSQNGYHCILCGYDCHCQAAEMIIYFD